MGDDLDDDEKAWIMKQLPRTLASVGAAHNSVLLCMDNDTQRSFLVTLAHADAVEANDNDNSTKKSAKFRVVTQVSNNEGASLASSPRAKRTKVVE